MRGLMTGNSSALQADPKAPLVASDAADLCPGGRQRAGRLKAHARRGPSDDDHLTGEGAPKQFKYHCHDSSFAITRAVRIAIRFLIVVCNTVYQKFKIQKTDDRYSLYAASPE